jgi:hypothetical protein
MSSLPKQAYFMKMMSLLVSNVLFAVPLSAATISLTAFEDTTLFQRQPDNNLGGNPLLSGTNANGFRSRGLFRFDFSSLPTNAVITDVQLQMSVTQVPDPDQFGPLVESNFGIHRMLVAWGEGTGAGLGGGIQGRPAENGESTWNSRLHSTTGASTPWTDSGAASGGDFETNPSSSTSIRDLGLYTWGSTPQFIGDIEIWIADPASNFGFLLFNQSEATAGTARRFASTENNSGVSGAIAPTLLLTFVPEPSGYALASLSLASFCLRRRRAAY